MILEMDALASQACVIKMLQLYAARTTLSSTLVIACM